MRAVVVALAVTTVSACSSRADAPSENRASASTPSAPGARKDLPDITAMHRDSASITLRATRIPDGQVPAIVYAVTAERPVAETLLALNGVVDHYALAQSDLQVILPWSFGTDDKTVSDKVTVHVPALGIDATTVAKQFEEARGHTSLPLSAVVEVDGDAPFTQLALVLDVLAHRDVRSVAVTLIPRTIQPELVDGGRVTSVPSISIGQPSVSGELDKAIIRRYIKRNIQKFQYCYEKQLLSLPTASGTMIMNFTILPTGQGSSARVTAPTPQIANCAETVVNGIEFPKPKDGQPVMVSYPISMRPAGG